MKIEVVIQTCPDREEAFAATVASLQASDVGADYFAYRHPPGSTLNNFFFGLLELMAHSSADYVIRLEDDVFVNKHIIANVRRWPALQEPDFGAGWLFTPSGVMGPSWYSCHRMTKSGEMWRSKLPMHSSVAYMFPTKLLPRIIEELGKLEKEYEGALMDLGVSTAVHRAGYKCFLHQPSLVEHNVKITSTMGHTYDAGVGTAGGLFRPDWRRP